jgi:hypothetical protein
MVKAARQRYEETYSEPSVIARWQEFLGTVEKP